MIELKPGAPTKGFADNLKQARQTVANAGTAADPESGQNYYLNGVETLDAACLHSLLDSSWYESVYTPGYWAVRDLEATTPRPFPLLQAQANRITRWIDDSLEELGRIERQDEWDPNNTPRVIFDTSALVREGEFDALDWPGLLNSRTARLIIPILVVRELDNLKNRDPYGKARARLRRIFQFLDGHGRGPAEIRKGITLELLMNPARYSSLDDHDQEIVRRVSYMNGRLGGPLTLITGDYTMLAMAQAEGVQARITPSELAQGVEPDMGDTTAPQ